MDPSYWQLDPGLAPTEPPPDYEPLDDEPLAIEAPPNEDDDDEELEGEEDIGEASKILDHLELPNYDDVQKRLDDPEIIIQFLKTHYT